MCRRLFFIVTSPAWLGSDASQLYRETKRRAESPMHARRELSGLKSANLNGPAGTNTTAAAQSRSTGSTVDASTTVAAPVPGPFTHLPAVTIRSRSGAVALSAKLYLGSGEIDETVAARLDHVLSDMRDPRQPKTSTIDRRLLQLLYRTAYHFQVNQIDVTSAYRFQQRRREGLHALGKAIDFSLPGVKAEALASYLRTLPRVGVGIYTHRRTRFVHLDVRDQSYHWLDASPPGRTWRGMSIGNRSLARRDAEYQREQDWPEGFAPPRQSS